MKCPRDQTELVEASLATQSCKRCLSCHGYFISLKGSKLGGVNLSQLKPRVAANTFCQNGKTLISPVSQRTMKYFEYKGIKLDYCESSDSIWMDNGEFESIVMKLTIKSKKEETSKNSIVLDVAGDGVIEFIGEAIGSLFDGF